MLRVIPLLPSNALNLFMVNGVLIDSGPRLFFHSIRRKLNREKPNALLLTHAHPDHQGNAAAICRYYDIPLWCSAAEERWVVEPSLLRREMSLNRLVSRWAAFASGPGHAPNRLLNEGDTVGSFVVVGAPGHTPGHIALFDSVDRVLLAGDVLCNFTFGAAARIMLPPRAFCWDSKENRRSLRKLAELRPAIVYPNHGLPIAGERFIEFEARLP